MLQILIKSLIFPIIKNKVEELASTVCLPFMVRLKYNALQKTIEKIVESITDLADKIIDNPYSDKNEVRKIGLNIALDILEEVSIKLNTVIAKIREQIK